MNDMTRVDAFFQLESSRGVEAVVLELKYTDRFSTRRVNISQNPKYLSLAHSSQLWRDPEEVFSDPSTNQLTRSHALGACVSQVKLGAPITTTLLLVSHPLDPTSDAIFEQYSHQLADPSLAIHATLEQFLGSMLTNADDDASRSATREIELRYLDHTESETLWESFRGRKTQTRRHAAV
ncbi:hypothetical protein J5O08_00880 [Cellulomonas sp. PS-H5]|nr:hypothetical protein [Cellulomonas sp. PS-H5]MBW0252608.1 hypothetical protein [Cellulomonas sp. PS-H5]